MTPLRARMRFNSALGEPIEAGAGRAGAPERGEQ